MQTTTAGWRKLLAILLCLSMLIVSVPMFAVSAVEVNTKLDTVTEDGAWSTSKGSDPYTGWGIDLKASGTEGYEGTGGLVAVMGEGNTYQSGDNRVPFIASPPVVGKLTSGAAYTMSFNIKASSADTYLILQQWATAWDEDHSAYAESSSPENPITEGKVPTEWTRYDVSFTAHSADLRFRFLLSAAAGEKIYLDNVHIYDANYQVVVEYEPATTIEYAVPQEEVVTLSNIASSDPGTKYTWYKNNGYTESNTEGEKNYIEIVKDGADDVGSLHVYQDNVTNTDMQLGIATDWLSNAYTYTLKMKVKGDLGYADGTETCKFYPYGCDSQFTNLGQKAGAENVSNWTELVWSKVSLSAESMYLIFTFSKYNWTTDFYVDNVQLINDSTGEDMLHGAGNFGTSGYENKTVNVYRSSSEGAGNNDWFYVNTTAWDNKASDYYVAVEDGGVTGQALHYNYTATGTKGTDIHVQWNCPVTVPAGTYTMKMWVKGTLSNGIPFRFVNEATDHNVDVPVGTYADWTEITVDAFTVDSAPKFLFYCGQYNYNTNMYIDNIQLLDASGNDALQGWGSFDYAEEPVVSTIKADSASASTYEWYWNTGTPTDNSYAEIATAGASDKNPGSLHFVQQNGEIQNMYIGIRTDAMAAGNYTLSMKVKGYVTTADMSLHFTQAYPSTDWGTKIASSTTNFGDTWQTLSWDVVMAEGQSSFLFYFSQYNNGADLYVDEIHLTKQGETTDLLNGAGDFFTPKMQKATFGNDWYNAGVDYPDSAGEYADQHYAEIVEDGYQDIGSVHLHQQDAQKDVYIAIKPNNVVVGTEYTLSFWMKGTAGWGENDGLNWDTTGGNNGVVVRSTSGYVNGDTWQKLTVTGVTFAAADNPFILLFSKYVGASDIYIDNMTLTDASGNDILDGRGNFYAVTKTETVIGTAGAVALPNGDFENFVNGDGTINQNQSLRGMQVNVGETFDATVYFNIPAGSNIVPQSDLQGQMSDMVSSSGSHPVGYFLLKFDETAEDQAALAELETFITDPPEINIFNISESIEAYQPYMDLFEAYYDTLASDGTNYTVEMREGGVAAKDMSEITTYALVQIAEWQSSLGYYIPSINVFSRSTVSIADYAERLLIGDYTDDVKSMAQAMLDYGQASYDYFKTYNTYIPADELTTYNSRSAVTDYDHLNSLSSADTLSALSAYRAQRWINSDYQVISSYKLAGLTTGASDGDDVGNNVWFEQDANPFTATTYAAIASQGYSGKDGSLRLHRDAGAPTTSLYVGVKPANIVTGKDYTFKAMVSGSFGYVSANDNLVLSSGSGAKMNGTDSDSAVLLAAQPDGWTEVTATVNFTYSKAALYFVLGGYTAASDLYIDNISLTDADGNDLLAGSAGTLSTPVYTATDDVPAFSAYSVILQNTNTLRVYFAETDTTKWTFALSDGTSLQSSLTATTDGRMYVEGGGINAANLGTAYTVVASYNGEAVLKLKLSCLSWAYSALNRNKDDVTSNLAKAMYYYYAAAAALV